MTEYSFSNGNDNPQFRVIDSLGRFFFSPALQSSIERGGLFHGHHLISNNVYTDAEFRTLFSRIDSVGYDQSDWKTNQAWLPSTKEDALRLGVPRHHTQHDPYDDFLRAKLREISDKAQQDYEVEILRLVAAHSPGKLPAGWSKRR